MLPPFATDTPAVRNALMEPGKNGGIMDAADEMDIVTNPNLAPYLRLPTRRIHRREATRSARRNLRLGLRMY
jgi:hypothetical protein